MTEFTIIVMGDNGECRGTIRTEEDQSAQDPTFEYPGKDEIPAVIDEILLRGSSKIGTVTLRLLLGQVPHTTDQDVKEFEKITNRIRYSISAAGLDSVYKCSLKGKGKRGARKMAKKIGRGWV